MSSPTAKRQKLGNLETALVSATNPHVSAHAASGQLQPRPPHPVCCPSKPCDLALLLLSPQANEIQSDESVTVKGVAVPMVIECKAGAKLDAVLAWVSANQPALEAKLKVGKTSAPCTRPGLWLRGCARGAVHCMAWHGMDRGRAVWPTESAVNKCLALAAIPYACIEHSCRLR